MIGVGLYWMIGIVAATVLGGMLLKWVIENFLPEGEASIASFSLLLGNSLSSLWPAGAFDYVWATERVGSVAGLCDLWWCLFRRKATQS